MNDLNPSESGGVYYNADSNRAIITWDAIPIYTDAGNGPTNTVQVVLNANGTIEMLFGNLGGIGPDYNPAWIGQIGISNGLGGLASDLADSQVDFSTLTSPLTVPARAVV